uniref:transposase n=1 Tax=uncultured Pseudokineococcus sp. TaxID=1642928 RepID=UPI0026071F8A
TTAQAAGVTGPVVARADSAYYGWAFIGTAVRRGITFSVTARQNPAVRAAIASIDEDAWTSITYPTAVYDEDEDRWISDAQVAEVPFAAFTSRRKNQHVHARLVVRRVRRLGATGTHAGQGELFDAWRHHAFLTNAPQPSADPDAPQDPAAVDTVAADARHRAHAVIEQVIAELKAGALAHLPSGHYAANAAWVSAAVMAFNLARATATAAGLTRARWATVRTRIINVPARVATRARRQHLHLPTHWPWATAWTRLWKTATGPPAPART